MFSLFPTVIDTQIGTHASQAWALIVSQMQQTLRH